MSAYRYSLMEILAEYADKPDDPEDRGLIERVASALYERFEDMPDMEQWPQSVQDFYALYDLEYQIGNGGFAQAAFNVPELFPIAKEAFLRMGRPEAAELCQKAIGMLPEEFQLYIKKELTEYPDLEEVFEHFDDSPMAELDEQVPDEFWVDPELQRLVKQNREDFESMESAS